MCSSTSYSLQAMRSYSWKKAECKADEQFHFANKKLDVTKNNNNKNEKLEKRKKEKERKKQTTITKHKNTNSCQKTVKTNCSGKNKTMLGRQIDWLVA